MGKPGAIRGFVLAGVTLLALVLLAGCGGGSQTTRVGSVEFIFIDASNPSNTELSLTGQITLAGQTAKLSAAKSAVISGVSYGSHAVACALEGYTARPATVVVDRARVKAEVVLVPDNDSIKPSLESITLINADGSTDFFAGDGTEVYRLSGLELMFTEYVEPTEKDIEVISISSPVETLILGPADWQLSRSKLTLSPSYAYDNGAQSFFARWQPGVTYTVSLANLADYTGNPFDDVQFSFTGSGDVVAPATSGFSGKSTEIGQQILLEWKPAADHDLWGYQLFRRVQELSNWTVLTEQPSLETAYLDDGLTNGLIYEYKIRAVDLNGNLGSEIGPIAATPASPNRGIIAFASDRQSVIDSVPDFDLYVKFFSAAGSEPAKRIEGLVPLGVDSNEDCPAWSPDGRRLAYTSTAHALNPELFIAEVEITHNGSGLINSAVAGDYQQLTFDGRIKASPTWSPDGKQIAFVEYSSSGESAESALMIIDVKRGSFAEILVSNGRRIDEPDWRPQGDKIVYCTEGVDGFWEIQVVGVGSGLVSSLSSPAVDGDDRDPAFSPDGSRIAFSSTRGYGPLYDQANLWIMDTDGSNLYQVTTQPGVADSAPTWSPDGTQLIFTRETGDQPAALYRVKASPGAQPELLEKTSPQEILQIPAAKNWLPASAK